MLAFAPALQCSGLPKDRANTDWRAKTFMPDFDAQNLALGLTNYLVLLFSLSFHESAHAWMALRLGDDTAASLGRITLNPMSHIDPFGTVLMPLLQIFGGSPVIGWAKPTPYDPGRFRRDVSLRRGHISVAAVGPLSNLLLAFVFAVLFAVIIRIEASGRHEERRLERHEHRHRHERGPRPLQPAARAAARRIAHLVVGPAALARREVRPRGGELRDHDPLGPLSDRPARLPASGRSSAS